MLVYCQHFNVDIDIIFSHQIYFLSFSSFVKCFSCQFNLQLLGRVTTCFIYFFSFYNLYQFPYFLSHLISCFFLSLSSSWFVLKRWKVLGMIQKQGHWAPYELKPRDVERRFVTCELLLQQQKRKGSFHRIVTGNEKCIHYDNPKRRKSWGNELTSSAKPNNHGSKLLLCIWWDQKGVIYYELLKTNETECWKTSWLKMCCEMWNAGRHHD